MAMVNLSGILIYDMRPNIRRVAQLMHGIEDTLVAFFERTPIILCVRVIAQSPASGPNGKKIAAIGMAIEPWHYLARLRFEYQSQSQPFYSYHCLWDH